MGLKIIMAVCLMPCLFLMYGLLYFEGKQSGNILLGVTLWPEADQEGEVTAIQKRFKKEMKLLFALSLLLLVGTCLLNRESLVFAAQMLWLIFVIVIFFIPIAKGNQRLKTLKKERKVCEKYGAEEGTAKEDDHWPYGIFYYNKNDKRFTVNKRVGIGTTVNMAKTSAKVFTGVVFGGVLALVLWVCGWILLDDFVPVSLALEEQAVVSGQYREDYRVPVSMIEKAELAEEMPAMSKRVGSAMEYIRKGSFMAEGYESCKVCVRTKKPPFLKITTADGMVYYLNDEKPETTEEVYEELTELLTTEK